MLCAVRVGRLAHVARVLVRLGAQARGLARELTDQRCGPLLRLLQDLARLAAGILDDLLRGGLGRIDDCVHFAADVGVARRVPLLSQASPGLFLWTIAHRDHSFVRAAGADKIASLRAIRNS
jgi:hypothetical protein